MYGERRPRFNLNPMKPKPLISNTIQQKKKLSKKCIATLPEPWELFWTFSILNQKQTAHRTMKTPQAAALIESLREFHLSCGEVVTGYHAAQWVCDYETDNGLEFTPQEILRAIRESGEQFVDSMQENEMDTESCVKNGFYDGHPIDPLETRLSRWEAMRPSTIRLAAIRSIIANH